MPCLQQQYCPDSSYRVQVLQRRRYHDFVHNMALQLLQQHASGCAKRGQVLCEGMNACLSYSVCDADNQSASCEGSTSCESLHLMHNNSICTSQPFAPVLQELVSPLQTALGLGLQYPPLATAAISALERWEVEQPQAVQTVAPHVVPLLDPYLAEFRDVAPAAEAASAQGQQGLRDCLTGVCNHCQQLVSLQEVAGASCKLKLMKASSLCWAGNQAKELSIRPTHRH